MNTWCTITFIIIISYIYILGSAHVCLFYCNISKKNLYT